MRFAVLLHQMQKSKNPLLNKFKLVLPPWSHLVHWSYRELPEQISWGLYFDINSLKMFAPVLEMYEFLGGNERFGKKGKLNISFNYIFFKGVRTNTQKWS